MAKKTIWTQNSKNPLSDSISADEDGNITISMGGIVVTHHYRKWGHIGEQQLLSDTLGWSQDAMQLLAVLEQFAIATGDTKLHTAVKLIRKTKPSELQQKILPLFMGEATKHP